MNFETLIVVDFLNNWVIIALVFGIVGIAWLRGVKVYEEFVIGAKEGFDVAVMIIPYLVAILCAIALFRYGGAMDVFKQLLEPITSLINMDPELLPLAIIRPMSGSGARGVMLSIWESAGGPDSLVGITSSVMQGSTETTFYVLAVYCGAVAVRRTRYTLTACLTADIAGILAAVWITNTLYGNVVR